MIFHEKEGGLVVAENPTDLKRKETLKAIETLSLLDDNLMTLVFDRNTEATELLLNVILQRDDLNMFYPVLERQVRYFNETEGGREIMCQAFEDLAEKRVVEEKKASARRLIARGKQTLEEIAEDTDLFLKK